MNILPQELNIGIDMLKRFVASRIMKVFVFAVMLITSGNELISNFYELGVHHGVVLFAVFQLMKALSEFYEAADILEET
jgi:predicted Abi (CAAX) family protease|tara:strand:- start:278 stop:514 length:237 start_codon:yes stop_codon:yes gene_type:complete